MKKYINASLSTGLYVIAVIVIYYSGPVDYQFIGNISPFWVSVVLSIAGLYFAYRSKKLNETGWYDYVLVTIGIVFVVIALLFLTLFSGF
jgi:hypothetical protein